MKDNKTDAIEVPVIQVKLEPGAKFFYGTAIWRVLKVNKEEQTVLVIAEECVCERSYHDVLERVTWETCSLRKWLNGEYLETTFTREEQEAIQLTRISTPDNMMYKTNGGNDTEDKVFILSIEEVKEYFSGKELLEVRESWWLRSPGSRNDYGTNCIGYYTTGREVNKVSLVRPALILNLQSPILEKKIKKNGSDIELESACILLEGTCVKKALPDISDIVIPEGITEISERCFCEMQSLKTVSLPTTLKKIGAGSFRMCKKLKKVKVASNSVSYGEFAFYGYKDSIYTAELFKTTGKLANHFSEHLKNVGVEELAYLFLYQQGEYWEWALSRKVCGENANEILEAMEKHIANSKDSSKKVGTAGADYIINYAQYLNSDRIMSFLETLKNNKWNDIVDDLLLQPLVALVINNEMKSNSRQKAIIQDNQLITDDGRVIQFAQEDKEITKGINLYFAGNVWRVLDYNKTDDTLLVISERSVCRRSYHDIGKNVTWKTCSLREWLNGEYLETNFTKEEQEAIQLTSISTPQNAKYKPKGGNDTEDKVFILSKEEVENYFESTKLWADKGLCWLRSPGSKNAYTMSSLGLCKFDGRVDYDEKVRPAMRLKLKSSTLIPFMEKKTDGKWYIKDILFVSKNGKIMYGGNRIEEIIIPNWIKKIEENAFSSCTNLKNVVFENKNVKIGSHAFYGCELDVLSFPAELYLGENLPDDDSLSKFIPDNAEVIANIFLVSDRYRSYIDMAIYRLNRNNASLITDQILAKAKKIKKIKCPEMIDKYALAVARVISKKQLSDLYDLIKQMKLGSDEYLSILWKEISIKQEESTGDVIKPIFDLDKAILETPSDLLEPLPGLIDILQATYGYCKDCSDNNLDTSNFKKAALDSYTFRPEGNALAEKMNNEALMKLLEYWAKNVNFAWSAPYAVYASEEKVLELIKLLKAWKKSKRKADIVRLRGALLLNNSDEVMRYADSLGLLGQYAKLRGLDEDTVRDSMMSDLGLDEAGHRVIKLGQAEYTVNVLKNLTVTLTDEHGKTLKLLPKKGVDANEYAAVNKEFKDLKNNIKTIAKLRNNTIFAAFLSGRARKALQWQKVYLENPVFRELAKHIVWMQGEDTFILNDDGEAVKVNGKTYTITDEDILVAHPMEMKKIEIKGWQTYFIEHQLSQPFAQVWEPVVKSNTIKKNRYEETTIPLYMFLNKEKHGIKMQGKEDIALQDCSAQIKLITRHEEWINNEYEIQNFTFEKYTRAVNHIVALFDKGTVQGRLLKDDVSAIQLLDRFTLSQIKEFIKLVTDKGDCPNVTAELLAYKEKNYPEADENAFADFILEW